MSRKSNLESKEDSKAYISFLSKIEKEVDQWPSEKKMRHSTSFYKELSSTEEKGGTMKKYEFTGETIEHKGSILKRIRRLSDGAVGGWIEHEGNLSHKDDCWISENARASGNARVIENARITGNAQISGNAWIEGEAEVRGNAKIGEDVNITGKTKVGGGVLVLGNGVVLGNVFIRKGESNEKV